MVCSLDLDDSRFVSGPRLARATLGTQRPRRCDQAYEAQVVRLAAGLRRAWTRAPGPCAQMIPERRIQPRNVCVADTLAGSGRWSPCPTGEPPAVAGGQGRIDGRMTVRSESRRDEEITALRWHPAGRVQRAPDAGRGCGRVVRRRTVVPLGRHTGGVEGGTADIQPTRVARGGETRLGDEGQQHHAQHHQDGQTGDQALRASRVW